MNIFLQRLQFNYKEKNRNSYPYIALRGLKEVYRRVLIFSKKVSGARIISHDRS